MFYYVSNYNIESILKNSIFLKILFPYFVGNERFELSISVGGSITTPINLIRIHIEYPGNLPVLFKFSYIKKISRILYLNSGDQSISSLINISKFPYLQNIFQMVVLILA